MAETLREALREQVTLRAVAQWLVAGAVLYHLLDPAPAQFVTTTVSMAIFGLTELVTDVYDVRRSVRNAGFGVYALIGGAAMALSDPSVVAFPVAFLLVGAWFVLDAVQTVRHEGATEDQPTGREVYHDYVGRRVREVLEDGPRTRRELSEALDADDESIDAAVAKLQSRGVVVREGSAFRAVDLDDGGMAAQVAGLVRRIARPLTLELGGDEADADAIDRNDSVADGNGGRSDRDDAAAGERGHEREYETADRG
ncbi:MFS transporter [Halosimplex litoreum]|uniref:MFS transporter n=1 Tax=Halosimplex litoreum TaxID=1198301 RepID=A0A7T3KWY3_9EURY|nr:MFS transporter [Halosimplex litoreum]QPV64410.1 MFS transporter [Halosimplex litoreum]